MTVTIKKIKAGGKISAPPSKSASHRALVAAALSDGETLVENLLSSDDIEATSAALCALGAKIYPEGCGVRVVPAKASDSEVVIDCNESGTTARFMLPIAAHFAKKATLQGRGRLPQRPFVELTEAMRKNGCDVSSDLIPITVSGGMNAGVYELSGSVSSQYISALLFVLPLLDGDSEIRLTSPLASAPYVNMTLDTMRKFGVIVSPTERGYNIKGNQKYSSNGKIRVEGDWSSASALLALGLTSEVGITLTGLDVNSEQGDKRILEFIKAAGGDVSTSGDEVTVKRGQMTEDKLIYDASDTPDLVPAIAVAAAARRGVTEIIGAARLREKESDRLATVAAMLSDLGGEAEITDDGLIINGKGKLRGGRADGAGDHRIVMCAAVAAALCDGEVTIDGAEAVSKSYPDFWHDFSSLGAIFE